MDGHSVLKTNGHVGVAISALFKIYLKKFNEFAKERFMERSLPRIHVIMFMDQMMILRFSLKVQDQQ